MENIYYSNVEYVDYQYFPVVLEDYEGTSDRPGCELNETAKYFASQVGPAVPCAQYQKCSIYIRSIQIFCSRIH